jgi:hypothetical protein
MPGSLPFLLLFLLCELLLNLFLQIWKKLARQISPCWIYPYDEFDFPDSQPALDFLLPSDCVQNVRIGLLINQAIQLVFVGESLIYTQFVLANALTQAIGHARVNCFRSVAHHVRVILTRFAGAHARRSLICDVPPVKLSIQCRDHRLPKQSA